MPLKNTYGRWQCSGMLGLFMSLSLLMPLMLEMGIPFRCGVELGVGAELLPGEIYGPVLQDAYLLEDKVAVYPRIVVGHGLVDFISRMPFLPELKPFDVVVKQVSAELAKLITKCSGGEFQLDYAGRSMRDMKISHWAKGIQKAHAFARKELDRFQSRGDHKLVLKYQRVVDYLEDSCGDFIEC